MSDPLSKRRLKIWIRLLGVTRAAESHLRGFLRVKHETTLPRFDVMAALYRRREGMTMGELDRKDEAMKAYEQVIQQYASDSNPEIKEFVERAQNLLIALRGDSKPETESA